MTPFLHEFCINPLFIGANLPDYCSNKVKTKQNRVKKSPAPKKTPTPRKPKKKLQFEDVVKGALISAAVVCAVVLGIGGFYIFRSARSNGYNPPALASAAGTPEQRAAPESEEPSIELFPGEISPPDDLSSAVSPGLPGEPVDPGLEQAIRDLEAAAANDAGANAAGANPTPANAAVTPAVKPAPTPGSPTPIGRKGILVLVIDDAGNNLRDLDPFLQFPAPITIAVLPGLANSVETARRVRAAGKELFLHQPMEPLNGQEPGPPGAIKTGMSPVEVKEILVKNLNEIGPVAGFNNHEGSRATADPAIMRPLLEVSRDSALYFLDSRTTADTAAPLIAKELGVKIAQRNFFLDNEQDREAILAVLESGCKWAEQNGTAILIGHAWSPRLAAILAEAHPGIIKRGLIFASIGTLLSRGK